MTWSLHPAGASRQSNRRPAHTGDLGHAPTDSTPAPLDGADASRAESPWRSLLRADLDRIAVRFGEADRRAFDAETLAGREAAEQERWDAAGEFWAAAQELADTFLLLLRYATDHRPQALLTYLLTLLASDREALVALGRLIREAEGGHRA